MSLNLQTEGATVIALTPTTLRRIMKWSEITPEHHRKWGHVSTESPGTPLRERGPFVGIIICQEPNTIPVLEVPQKGTSTKKVMTFAGWYDVVLA
jgi:hypothetical protein